MGQTALAATKKRARRQNALIVFEDESGVSLLPSVRATWAPRGQTPVLHHAFNYKRLSLAGALAFEPLKTSLLQGGAVIIAIAWLAHRLMAPPLLP